MRDVVINGAARFWGWFRETWYGRHLWAAYEEGAARRTRPTDLPFPLSYRGGREARMRLGLLPPDAYRSSLSLHARRRVYAGVAFCCGLLMTLQYPFLHWLEPYLGVSLPAAARTVLAVLLGLPLLIVSWRGVRDERRNHAPATLLLALATLGTAIIGFVHGFDWAYHALTGHFPPDIA